MIVAETSRINRGVLEPDSLGMVAGACSSEVNAYGYGYSYYWWYYSIPTSNCHAPEKDR